MAEPIFKEVFQQKENLWIEKMEVRTQKLFLIAILCGIMLILSSCQETGAIGEFQSIPQLYDTCPGKCGEQLACEGRLVSVWGYLDAHNIFEQSQSVQERERFLIAERLDAQGFGIGKVIEVYPPQGRNNAALFDILNEPGESSRIFITGTVKSYDAPTNLSCERLISLGIQGEDNVNTE